MSEYINRGAAFDAITDLAGKASTRSAYEAVWKSARALKKISAADVAPVVHGRWINEDFPDRPAIATDPAICSNCGEMAHKAEHGYAILSKYCPYCGAKMDGGTDNG